MRSMTAGTIAGSCVYAYDAAGVLARIQADARMCQRFWRGGRVVNEVRSSPGGNAQLTWLRSGGAPLAELIAGEGARTSLLASSLSGSVLLEADQSCRPVRYAPYGHRDIGPAGDSPQAEPAFNGEMLDAVSGCYLLGEGHHRPYSPTLGHFLAPDRAGPFGRGGLNTLSYCAGDPINRADPSGHFWNWVIAAAGLVLGIAATALSFGVAATAVGAVVAGGLGALTKTGASAIAGAALGAVGAVTDAAALAAGIAGDQATAGILGWVGLGIGIAGGAGAVTAKVMKASSKAVGKLATKQASFSSRTASLKSVGGASTSSGKPTRTLMQDILAPQWDMRQDYTVMMMRQGGGAGTARGAASRSSGSVYVSEAAAANAQVRGHVRLNDLADAGRRIARANARDYIRNNGYPENLFDFNHQRGLYNVVDNRYLNWDVTQQGRSRTVPRVPDAAPEAARGQGAASSELAGQDLPPTYEEASGHLTAHAFLPPSYSSLPPPPYRR